VITLKKLHCNVQCKALSLLQHPSDILLIPLITMIPSSAGYLFNLIGSSYYDSVDLTLYSMTPHVCCDDICVLSALSVCLCGLMNHQSVVATTTFTNGRVEFRLFHLAFCKFYKVPEGLALRRLHLQKVMEEVPMGH
jgi:hypothetical protein